MSKHNYSQYSKKQPTQNNNHKSSGIDHAATNPIPEIKPVEETVDTVTLPEMVEGVVVNCTKLNVRVEPKINAEIVCVLDVMTEIEIDINKSTDEWFKVCTAAGVEGYSMRKFIDAHL